MAPQLLGQHRHNGETQYMVFYWRIRCRDSLGHLLDVASRGLEQAMHIEVRGVFDRAGEALEAPKVRREVGIQVRERGSD
jgi:hypothetical protein